MEVHLSEDDVRRYNASYQKGLKLIRPEVLIDGEPRSSGAASRSFRARWPLLRSSGSVASGSGKPYNVSGIMERLSLGSAMHCARSPRTPQLLKRLPMRPSS